MDDVVDIQGTEAGGKVVACTSAIAGEDADVVSGVQESAIGRRGICGGGVIAGHGVGALIDVVEVAGCAAGGDGLGAATGVGLLGGQLVEFGVGATLRGSGFLVDEGHDACHGGGGNGGSADLLRDRFATGGVGALRIHGGVGDADEVCAAGEESVGGEEADVGDVAHAVAGNAGRRRFARWA